MVELLTDKRCLPLFPAGTTVRDPHHQKYATHCEQCLNLCKTCEFKHSWLKLCSSGDDGDDNDDDDDDDDDELFLWYGWLTKGV